MTARTGTVMEASGTTAKVRLEAHLSCEKCGMCMGGQPRQALVTAKDPLGVGVGDVVEVELAPEKSLKAALIVYLSPLLFLFVGITLGTALTPASRNKEAYAAVAGLASASLGFVFVRYLDKTLSKGEAYAVTVTGVISRGATHHPEAARVQAPKAGDKF